MDTPKPENKPYKMTFLWDMISIKAQNDTFNDPILQKILKNAV